LQQADGILLSGDLYQLGWRREPAIEDEQELIILGPGIQLPCESLIHGHQVVGSLDYRNDN
jgi:hypothetical protein